MTDNPTDDPQAPDWDMAVTSSDATPDADPNPGDAPTPDWDLAVISSEATPDPGRTGDTQPPMGGAGGVTGSQGHAGGRPIVLLLSGANLNLFGQRDPDIYGTDTLDDFVGRARAAADGNGLDLEHLQSNLEGELVEAVHAARGRAAAIIVNPGAFGHYAWSLHDALAAFDGPVVELHVSNPYAREPWRHTSVIAPVADGTVAGFKGHGYELAVDAVARLLA